MSRTAATCAAAEPKGRRGHWRDDHSVGPPPRPTRDNHQTAARRRASLIFRTPPSGDCAVEESIEVGLLACTIGPAGTRPIEGQAIGLGQHSRGDGVNINNSLVAADKDDATRQLFDNSQRRRRELRRKAEPFVHLDRPLEMGGQPLQQFVLVGRRGPRVSRPHDAEEAKSIDGR